LATSDQPPGDTDNQAIRIVTTTASNGYAGVLFHHVTGIPAAAFPDSEFWVKTPNNNNQPSLGSPRLVVEFQTATGAFDGYGDLRPLFLTSSWQDVSDQSSYPLSGWDVMGGPCGFRYNVMWSDVQSCFSGDTTLSVFLTTDPYGVYHLIDDMNVDGKTFTDAASNGNGDNTSAGPAASDPSLIPSSMLSLYGL
jgi:hypothetical protein